MKKSIQCLCLLLIAGIIAACGAPATSAPTAAPAPTEAPTAVPAPAQGGDLVMGVNAEDQTLDPAKAFYVGDAAIMRNIYDTLVYVDSDHNLHPGLALSWEQSEDAKTFTFTLRQGVTFHDGTPFNAEAVKYNFDRFGNPDITTGNPSVPFADYGSSEVVDEYTVRVTFNSPKPLLLYSLGSAYSGIPSPTAIEAQGENFGQNPVGTGPFKFSEWKAGESVTIVRNPDYAWAPDIFQHDGPAYLDSVTFRVVLEDPTRIAMLQSGEAHVVEQFPAQDISWLQTDQNYYLVSATAPGLPTIMEINTDKAPTDELAVRQALAYAIDQEALVAAAFFDTQKPVHNVLAPTTLYYDTQAADAILYDPDKARALLEEAGWVDEDGDGVRERGGESLTINYPAYRVWETSYMELLKDMWSQVGFDVQLEQLEDAAAWEAAVAGEHNVTNMGAIAFDASVLYSSFHSSNIPEGYAFTRYADPQLDDLLTQAGEAVDPAEAADLYAQAQRLIMEQALVVPVYAFERILAISSAYPGVTLDWESWYPYFYDARKRQ